MKVFVASAVFCLVGASFAAPQYGNAGNSGGSSNQGGRRPSGGGSSGGNSNQGGGRRPQQPRCQTINEIKYVEEFDTVCETIYDYQLCVPTSRQQCDPKRRQKCNDDFKTVYDTVYDTEYDSVCRDIPSYECPKVWNDDGKGGKIWSADTNKNNCVTLATTECEEVPRQVPRQVARQEKYQTCDWENYQDCYAVSGAPNCQYVAQSVCHARAGSVNGAKCNQQPKKDCKQVHKEVPTQVSRQVCEGDSDWDDVRDGTYSANVVANAFNQATTQIKIGSKDVKAAAVPGVRSGAIDDNEEDNSDGIVFSN